MPGYRLLNETAVRREPSINSGGQAGHHASSRLRAPGLPAALCGQPDIMTAAATKVGEEIAKGDAGWWEGALGTRYRDVRITD